MRSMLKQLPLRTDGKSGILKNSYFDVSMSEIDAEIIDDTSVEEEYVPKFYMNDLVEALEDIKNMLSGS